VRDEDCARSRRRLSCLAADLGFKLKKHQRFLQEFASFLEQESTSQITSRLALLWATQPKHIQPAEWAARLSVVRGFAHYWSATDATTEVPPDGLLPYRPRRAKPYLYSEEQIHQLLETAKNMPATHSLQPWTYCCLLGLLAVTGLRISETLNLRCQTSTGRKACSRSAMLSSENLDWFLPTFRA
jgi:integrase/recombinase XerD